MPGGYIICEYEKVKEQFPEFKAVMNELKTRLVEEASAAWGISAEKFTLKNGHLTTIIPALFRGQQTVAGVLGAQLTTWEQWFNATGSQTIMTGAATGGTIYEDYKVGLAGLVFLDKAIRISEIKMQISDKKLPRINIEEAMAYEKPAIVFEEGYMLDEEAAFELVGYVMTQGPQTIKLIGFQLNRIPNKLQVTDTGAALT